MRLPKKETLRNGDLSVLSALTGLSQEEVFKRLKEGAKKHGFSFRSRKDKGGTVIVTLKKKLDK